MTPSNAVPIIEALLSSTVPVMLWGAPGIGKSDIVRQAAGGRGWPVIDVRAVQFDPVDLRGVPAVVDGRTQWAVPDFLPRVDRDGPEGVLFLDELPQARTEVQAALFQLVLDRRLGEYALPAGWRIIAAGNRAADRSGANRMPRALANRFAHVDIEADAPAWCAWAAGAGISPAVVAFISFRPNLLHDMRDPDANAFPTPRSWTQFARMLPTLHPDMVRPVAGSIIGAPVAAEFAAFLAIFSKCPRVADILADPEGAPVPDETSLRHALATGLAAAATVGTAGAIGRYLARMPAEFAAMAWRQAAARLPALESTAAYTQWAIREANAGARQ